MYIGLVIRSEYNLMGAQLVLLWQERSQTASWSNGIKRFYQFASLENGTKFVDGKLIIDEEKNVEDEGKADDDITMEIIRQVSEDVDPMIKLTIDVPS